MCIYLYIHLSILLVHPSVYTSCSVWYSCGLFHPAKAGGKGYGGLDCLSLWVFKIYSSKCNIFCSFFCFPSIILVTKWQIDRGHCLNLFIYLLLYQSLSIQAILKSFSLQCQFCNRDRNNTTYFCSKAYSFLKTA